MKKLAYHSGNGFQDAYENGFFEIKFGSYKKREFKSFQKAKLFYDSLNEEKAFWDISKGFPELLDSQTFQEESEIGKEETFDDLPF